MTILNIAVLQFVLFQFADAQNTAEFKAHLYAEKQYRELAILLEEDSLADKTELVSALVAQNLYDSAYKVARFIPLSSWTDSSEDLRSALGILYCDSSLLFLPKRAIDSCRSADNISAWRFTHGHTQGLNFCSPKLSEEYMHYKMYQYKNPMTAGILSAVVPGMGKVYTGYKKQFWGSFLPTIFLAAAAAESSRNGYTSPRFLCTMTIFSIFYSGNIWGTVHLANNHNNNANKSFNTAIELHYRAMLSK